MIFTAKETLIQHKYDEIEPSSKSDSKFDANYNEVDLRQRDGNSDQITSYNHNEININQYGSNNNSYRRNNKFLPNNSRVYPSDN